MTTENGFEQTNTTQRTERLSPTANSVDTPGRCLDYSQNLETQQILSFLAFIIKESIQKTVYALVQNLWCTWILLSSIPKTYFDSIRFLLPLWLAAIHAFCIVSLLLCERLAADALYKIRHIATK